MSTYTLVKRPRGGGQGDVDERGSVMLLDLTACASLIFSSPLTYVSFHPIPYETVTNEFDTGVGARV